MILSSGSSSPSSSSSPLQTEYVNLANSKKYGPDCFNILSVGDGLYALFTPWTQADGKSLIAIDTWSNLEEHYLKTPRLKEDVARLAPVDAPKVEIDLTELDL